MNSKIIKAIDERLLLEFTYKGMRRTVEPHTYGCTKKGLDGLCAWQLQGGSGEGYRMFFENEMSDISPLEDRFEEPRADYHSGDQRFTSIYAEL